MAGKRGQTKSLGGKEQRWEDKERVQGKDAPRQTGRKGGVPPGDLGRTTEVRVPWEEQAEEPRAFGSFLNWHFLPPVITVECGFVAGLSLGTG